MAWLGSSLAVFKGVALQLPAGIGEVGLGGAPGRRPWRSMLVTFLLHGDDRAQQGFVRSLALLTAKLPHAVHAMPRCWFGG